MQQILLLFILLQYVLSASYSFGNLNITTTLVSQATIDNTQSDTCGKLLICGQFVHHLSTTNIYKNWAKGSLTTTNTIINYNTSSTLVNDFNADAPVGKLIFNTAGLLGTSTNTIYSLDLQANIMSSSAQSLATTPELVFINGNDIYYFFGSSIKKSSTSSVLILGSLSLFRVYEGMVVTPDFTKAMLWDSTGDIAIYNLATLTQISTFSLGNAASPGTISISFSQDSLQAVIESDSTNPVTIYSLASSTVIKTIAINDVIVSAYFLDQNSNKLVIFGRQAVVFADLVENTTYSIPVISGVVYGADQQNNIFACYDNILYQVYVDFQTNMNTSSNSTTNTTNTTNTTTRTNSSTGGQTNGSTTNNTQVNPTPPTQPDGQNRSPTDSPQQTNFYKPLDIQILDQTGQQIFHGMNTTLSGTTAVADIIIKTLLNSPFTIYFLGFLNFVSLSSLYVLLNFQLPQQIYFYLSSIYLQMGKSFLPIIGIDPQISQISQEKVTSERALFHGITSDLLSGNINDYIMLGINQSILILALLAFNLFLSKSNILRLLLNRNFKLMLYGEFISLIQPVTLLWTFIFLSPGAGSRSTMANQIAFTFLFFFCIFLTIYYMFQLINSQKHKIKAYMIISANKDKTNNLVNQRKIVQKNIHLLNYISKDVVWQWFLCFSNFILPFLVLLQDPTIFLIIIAFYQFFGVYINSKGPQRSINQIVLSLYPLLFHICFMIFFWAPWPKVMLYTEIFCFAVLIAGLIHNMIIVAIEACHFVYRILRWSRPHNKISPQVDNSIKNIDNQLISPIEPSISIKIQQRVANLDIESPTTTKKRKSQRTSLNQRIQLLQPPNPNTMQLKRTRWGIRQSNELFVSNSLQQQKENKVFIKKARASQIIDELVLITADKAKKKIALNSRSLLQV